jgi:hypothetical protein
MGLKCYRLWVMGQLDSNVQSPTSTRFKSDTASKRLCRALKAALDLQ